jgi:nitric oxide reductase subunit B
MNNKPALLFILTSLAALLLAIFFGLIASLDFISASPLISWLPFQKLRPIHVSLAIAWIFAASTGGIYFYIKGKNSLRYIHLWLFIITGVGIIISYFAGIFGGREYWEFHPAFILPIIICWIFFGFNFFNNLKQKNEKVPVYIWMWSTGIIFFFFTYLEANLWIFSYFNENIVRDLTVQWKAYGALVGSWNMLVYGTALYLLEKISGEKKYSASTLAYSLFFLGLINLMFGWAHHIYFVPAAKWIRITGYAISMTELIILGRLIWMWRQNLTNSRKHSHIFSFNFLSAADAWILINITLAIAISIPAVNVYSHGTLITAAHAMGSTIGINTMILLASIVYIVSRLNIRELYNKRKIINSGFILLNASLFVFFVSLTIAGLVKGMMTYSGERFTNNEVMSAIKPYYYVIIASGAGLVIGITLIALPLSVIITKSILGRKNKKLSINKPAGKMEEPELITN